MRPQATLPEGPWDAIVIVDVLYLLDKAGRVRIARRLRRAACAQGGVLVVKETDVVPRWKHWVAERARGGGDQDPAHHRGFVALVHSDRRDRRAPSNARPRSDDAPRRQGLPLSPRVGRRPALRSDLGRRDGDRYPCPPCAGGDTNRSCWSCRVASLLAACGGDDGGNAATATAPSSTVAVATTSHRQQPTGATTTQQPDPFVAEQVVAGDQHVMRVDGRRHRVLLGLQPHGSTRRRYEHRSQGADASSSGSTKFARLAAGRYFTCGLTSAGCDLVLGRQLLGPARQRHHRCRW